MIPDSADLLQERVLLLLATTRDAHIACGLLRKHGIAAYPCADAEELVREVEGGTGAVVMAEEALEQGLLLPTLAQVVARQPAWSDLPVLVVARPGANSLEVGEAMATLGNVTLLEKPLRVAALVSTGPDRDANIVLRDPWA